MPPLPQRADVVVVGGGVIGVSAAFHLAEAGAEVVLLERGTLAGGSTSRAAGGVRSQFSDEVNIHLAQRSLAAFAAFGERPGWEIDFKPVGYLFVLSHEADLGVFRRNVALQNSLGLPSRMVSAGEAKALCPLLREDGVLAGAFSPQDGHATPEAVVQGYAYGARRRGAHLRVGCEVSDVPVRDGAVTGVVTPEGTVATSTVICAAGAWSRGVAGLAGIDLPVTPLRRQILFTEPIANLPGELPMTIDFSSSFYFHREGPGLLLGMSDPNETPGFSTETTDDWIPALLAVAAERAPIVTSVGIRGGWAGLYEVTPDHNALIGEAPGVSRFLYATGFSGHGFLQGPAVGEIMRDLVLEREPFVDVTGLSAERFDKLALRPEYTIV